MDIEIELVSSQFTVESVTPSIQEVQPSTADTMRWYMILLNKNLKWLILMRF
jgi:hypothetical protein